MLTIKTKNCLTSKAMCY